MEAGFEVTAREIISVGSAALSEEERSAVAGGAHVSYFENNEDLDISSLRDRGGDGHSSSGDGRRGGGR